MSAERGGLLKSRAEDFARHLRTRLRSLSGPEDGGGWAEPASTDAEVYYDIDSSLASPQEELPEPLFIAAQNRDTLPLQRSESSGSEYFDSVEELSQPQPALSTSIPFLKKIPILHLKAEKPVSLTNGHTNVIDADLGCSRVLEMPCEDVEPGLTESSRPVEDNCDISSVDNNNTWTDMEDVVDKIDKLDLEPLIGICNGEAVSLETDVNFVNSESSIDSEETIETLGNTNCVFCDIEQAKSSFSNSSVEFFVSQLEDQRNSRSKDNSADKEPDKVFKNNLQLQVPHEPSSGGSSDTEESVPLKDLLQVLKKEISKDLNEIKASHADSETNEGSLQSESPRIEVRESTPTTSTTDLAEPEKKEDEFDIELKRKNFRRCSSLKCGKTPPGTPGRKKIVRFADVLGLDLADVKTFLDEVPTVPKSAYSDLHLLPDSDSGPASSVSSTITVVTPHMQRILVPLFQQPCLTPNFMDRVKANNLCLESAAISDMSLFAITGVVRVRNIDFHKSVYVRYSINGWRNYSDLQARYIPSSCDGFSDKFSFVLYAHTLTVGQKLEFAVRFHTAGTQFWDNNGGVNYVFECVTIPQTHNSASLPSPADSWASFL